ncbi:RDD family protein [Mycolicibacterium goodii]|uniref:RDD family protein n=1 Tax=Mycolicibacterium goodii TaxID=134601 RepID=UPI001F037D83|nr:RDD family protein [Mycolicibacterium goodii]ULN47963.1 RDD family protein [Mycolicibacterium goodii]
MSSVLDTPATSESTAVDPAPLASWQARAAAFAIDVLPGVGVIVTLALLAWAAPLLGWAWWVYTVAAVVVVGAVLANRVLLPTTDGWTVGRAVVGIRVVRSDGGEVGLVRLLLRDLAHLLDTVAVFVGWLWPLWDARHRTFADLLTRTEVRRATPPGGDVRRRAGTVLLAAVAACAVAVGFGYLAVFRPQEAVHEAREQIADEGPRIVEQMLSYGVDSFDDDLDKAQTLTTDKYRPELIAQQDVIRKAGPTTNEYWAVSSAVLSATKTEASMLLALQGQRGTNPQDLKFLTATVRVDFRKSGDTWQVDNLTVLKKPNLNGAAQ